MLFIFNQCLVGLSVLAFHLFLSATSYAEVYRWVDEQGRVHYGDSRSVAKSKAANAEAVTLAENSSKWSAYDIKVRTYGVDLTEQELHGIQSDVKAVYQFYDRTLYFDIYKTVPVDVELFASRKQFIDHIKTKYKTDVTQAYGVFLGKHNVIALYLQKNRERTFATLRHEVSHAIIKTIAPATPAWLNEGMAEQMETLQFRTDHFIINRHPRNYSHVQQFGADILISEMLAKNSSAWRQDSEREGFIYQSIAGELIYFLMSNKNGRAFVTRILHEYSRGSRVKSRYLIDQNYIGSLPALENKWKLWVLGEGKVRIALDF